ncbi:dephospho-CoA kinase/protein folding accessory domain-containing protein [Labrenzia sp. THAF82]|uniref:GrpB family protein n=1 Tax=Labrenzia sp. THAF82 TaxID=2587861 RepID=UPI001267D84C|nr:GrpB family protein [Labrenzia sp. THAF82]QFT33898.1 dephospho-CoA kinase/protein folding accessory domain-containing protein [Labrenzia sp. THAF82]
MALTSVITEYDERWPGLFEQEALRLRPVFGLACSSLHHVGSTAVIGLPAKPEIDILAVVAETTDLDDWEDILGTLGYQRGGDLMDGHHFFKRDVGGIRTHKLHICQIGHSQILRMLKIRDHLRKCPKDRDTYKALKLRLEQENQSGIAEYLNGKTPFLEKLFRKIEDGT